MRALVVDDEAPARRRTIRMLERIDGVSVIGEARDGIEALEEIRARQPDVVLLDIDMPGLDGLELARREDLPPIIFITAHREHALEAFDVAAVDYLLKPVKQDRLAAALERLRTRAAGVDLTELAAMLGPVIANRSPSPPSATVPRISARAGNTVHVFDARVIGRFTAEDKYTVFVHEGREHVLEESLTSLEARLSPHEFVRVHRRELVNLDHVTAIHVRDRSVVLELRGGHEVPVSRRQVAELKRRLHA